MESDQDPQHYARLVGIGARHLLADDELKTLAPRRRRLPVCNVAALACLKNLRANIESYFEQRKTGQPLL